MKHVLIVLALMCVVPLPLSAGTCEIENATLKVQFDDVSRTFTALDKPSGKVFLSNGLFDEKVAKAVVEAAKDDAFGQGNRILVNLSNGSSTAVEVYRDLPFVLVKRTVVNQANAAVDVQTLSPVSFTLNLDKAAAELKTIGTGGLLAPEKNPGSYLFLTCADPSTRTGVVSGWITQNKGSGTVFSTVTHGAVNFRAQIEHGHLFLQPGQSVNLDTFAIGYFNDARVGEEKYADAVAKANHITLRPRTAVYCTWYADRNGGAGNEKSTIELANFIGKELKAYGLGVIQLDDEWQSGGKFNGPKRGFLQWQKDGPYPNGFSEVSKSIHEQGLVFGLWTLPFARNFQDPEYKDRQEWFVKRSDGKPYDTPWGGTCLDLTNPEVKAQLAALAKVQRQWGARYFKMDGLWTGAACEQIYINDGFKDDHFGNNKPLHDPSKTNVEAYRDGLKLMRQNAGDDVFFSGCCIAQNMREMTAIGLVDSMRIGPDFNHDKQGIRTGPLRGSRLYFLNGRVWWNDPDPTKVRTSKESGSPDAEAAGAVSLEHARLTSSWVSIADQFYLISDWLPNLPSERLDILKRTMASHGATARPVDYFDNELANTWLVSDNRSGVQRHVVGIFNFYGSPLKVDYSFAKMGLEAGKTYHAFDFWANQPMADVAGSVKDEIPATSCRVLALRAVEGHPVLISTSRHVSQGIVDVKEEKWIGNDLSGISEVIGNDPYELRITGLEDGGKTWTAAMVEVSAEDQSAGVSVKYVQTPGMLRVTLTSPAHRIVKWRVKFQ